MLLSNQKIDYPPVRRVPNVKLTGQNPSSTTVTTPPPSSSMPTSTSLQDISSHAQKFTWTNTNDNNNNNNKDQRLGPYPATLVRAKPNRQLTTSQSDERIFEHPEVTIKPSALDDELQRRLLNMRTSNTTDNLLDQDDARQSAPNILEHPDMRTPVVMQSQQTSSSSSSSALLIQTDCKRVSRTQSADAYTTLPRTPSPGKRVEFFIDNQSNPKRSLSPGSGIADIIESPEHEKDEDVPPIPRSATTTTTGSDFIGEYTKPRSKSDDNRLNTNDS